MQVAYNAHRQWLQGAEGTFCQLQQHQVHVLQRFATAVQQFQHAKEVALALMLFGVTDY